VSPPLGFARRILDLLEAQRIDFRPFLAQWFVDTDFDSIRLGNLEEFLAWALFATRPEDLDSAQVRSRSPHARGRRLTNPGQTMP
jgi:hypothetical protein